MKKYFVAALAMLSLSSAAYAIDNEPEEGVTIQAVGGLTVSNINGIEDLSAKAGGTLGVNLEYMLPNAKGTYVTVGANWTMKGAKFNLEDQDFGTNGIHNINNTYTTNYAQIPIHLGFRYNFTDEMGVYADFGPYFALGIAGINRTHVDADGSWTKQFEDSYPIFISKKDRMNFQRMDAGIGFRIGAEYDNHYSINLGLDWGLSDMWRDSYRDHIFDNTSIVLDKAKNFCFSLTFGYRL